MNRIQMDAEKTPTRVGILPAGDDRTRLAVPTLRVTAAHIRKHFFVRLGKYRCSRARCGDAQIRRGLAYP